MKNSKHYVHILINILCQFFILSTVAWAADICLSLVSYHTRLANCTNVAILTKAILKKLVKHSSYLLPLIGAVAIPSGRYWVRIAVLAPTQIVF